MPTNIDKVLVWGSDIEPETIAQAAKASRLPFLQGHLALMPDAHVGMGATIGSVIPTRGAIIPSAVGVDIGCGMIAAETSLVASDLPDDLSTLHTSISTVVPAGLGKAHETQSWASDDPRWSKLPELPTSSVKWSDKDQRKTHDQFGTLGSGNHFVEVCLDESDRVWIVLHSGSRGIGNTLAQRHIEGAKGIMARYFIELEDPDLAYLVEGTPEFDEYITDMLWAQRYAMANREAMIDAVLAQLFVAVGWGSEIQRINCHHNYTEMEHHHGKDVWLTRKGAIRARRGDFGVIPGSMGTASYIVSGLGNPASYDSCSHGAGRRMSRSAARKSLTVESLREQMGTRSWDSEKAEELLDEHPMSYKDIDQVMADQADLVKIEHTLRQVLNYKGT
jgi:tRNA-splicing ligase RtcB (3'-phosphate/5'-hydroxy nucleic acid ligase)